MFGVRSLSIVVCAVLLPACGSKDAPGPDAKTTPEKVEAAKPSEPPAERVQSQAPGVRDDGTVVSAVDWFHGSLEEALARAKAEDRRVFVDVGAYWCPPCQQLDEEVFVDAEVAEALGHGYVALHIDAEKGEGPELVREYRVQAYPTLLVLEPDGVEKGRVVDFLPADELLLALERINEGQDVLAAAIEKVEAKPDDIELRQRLGHLHVLAGQRKRAQEQFDRVLEADPTNEMGLASKVLYDRAVFIQYKLDDDPQGAISALRKLQAQFPDSAEAVRAYRHIGRMLNGLGKPDEAIAALDDMLETDPEDVGLASSYGWFCFRQRCKPQRGLEVVRQALEKHPKNTDLLYLEAELAELTGDRDAARAAIGKASALEPGSAFLRRQVQRFEATP